MRIKLFGLSQLDKVTLDNDLAAQDSLLVPPLSESRIFVFSKHKILIFQHSSWVVVYLVSLF